MSHASKRPLRREPMTIIAVPTEQALPEYEIEAREQRLAEILRRVQRRLKR